jgi:hypothetical protein
VNRFDVSVYAIRRRAGRRRPFDDGLLEVAGGRAGGVEVAQQGQGLASHRLLDQRELAHLHGPERSAQPGGFGVEAAASPALAEQGPELGKS